mmetsp:Transcript_854/g.1009  ORF Transcript_854/g.1009 Transcript_854/m.1009 type:complete len:285 (-) Transcript_854:311-1165(-)
MGFLLDFGRVETALTAAREKSSHDSLPSPTAAEEVAALYPVLKSVFTMTLGEHRTENEEPDWSQLPPELLMLTASYLPETLGSLCKLAGVCSGWREAILADKGAIARVAVRVSPDLRNRLEACPETVEGRASPVIPKLLTMAVELGNIQGICCAAEVYEDHSQPQQAYSLWEQAATAGNIHGQFRLGCLYYYGDETLGQSRDCAASLHWLLKAATGLQSGACLEIWQEKEVLSQTSLMLAYMYMDGEGTETREEEAINWLVVAKSCGSREAESALAWMQQTGNC